jgi:hypothetical protein
MQTLRSDGARRARLRLGRESLRRLDRSELERVRGGEAAREDAGEGGEGGLVLDQRSMDGCPRAAP